MRQLTLSIPDNYYLDFIKYLKDKPEILVDEKFEYFDKTVPQWQQEMVLERIKNAKPEDYRSWEDVKKDLNKKWRK